MAKPQGQDLWKESLPKKAWNSLGRMDQARAADPVEAPPQKFLSWEKYGYRHKNFKSVSVSSGLAFALAASLVSAQRSYHWQREAWELLHHPLCHHPSEQLSGARALLEYTLESDPEEIRETGFTAKPSARKSCPCPCGTTRHLSPALLEKTVYIL